ncbi:MAG: hypothetical protein UW79_C0017G0009 [Candidatus Yanofskybacteria bacterium GW2011_GWA2_44_9]|uniref:Uncharacterized protein n=2 Tax=Candidatus Yanofskyibacteriota TaxID=1752733 RepID=A0A0G1NBK4_9BACT|nr:MAG: hypothetical protein UW79_C0017G0009 [Candidatus Yanofskybacteria bacterium GW2011_GWA2_44_9]
MLNRGYIKYQSSIAGMLKNIQTIAALTSLIFSGLYPFVPLHAQTWLQNLSTAPGVNLTNQDVFDIIVRVACQLTQWAMILIVIALVFYAFLFFKSRGNPQELKGAQTALKWGLIGGIVIFGVYTIIRSVAALVGAQLPGGFLPLTCS